MSADFNVAKIFRSWRFAASIAFDGLQAVFSSVAKQSSLTRLSQSGSSDTME